MTHYSDSSNYELWPVLEKYGWDLPAPRSGWVTIKCGIHDDSTASCRVNNELGAMACMACGFSADTIKLIEHYEGCGYREAKRIAEEICGDGDGNVREGRGRGNRLSSGKRNNAATRGYVPPRLRGRTVGGR